MKTIITISCLTVLLVEIGVCDPVAGYVSHLQTRQGSYTWDISAARLDATPEWTSETQPIPLSLNKACQLGRDWLKKHNFTGLGLDEVRLLSYPDPETAAMSHGKTKRRFYYWMMYRSEAFDGGIMYVYVLMDGSVVEPKLTPTPDKKP